MDGLLLVDKPSGPTSHDVVFRVRKALREKRIGHTGTLDPMASGVLPLVVGRATRLARFLPGTKAYDAVIRLGQNTDTCDAQGESIGPAFAERFSSSRPRSRPRRLGAGGATTSPGGRGTPEPTSPRRAPASFCPSRSS